MLHKIRKAAEKEEYMEIFKAVMEVERTDVDGKPRKRNFAVMTGHKLLIRSVTVFIPTGQRAFGRC